MLSIVQVIDVERFRMTIIQFDDLVQILQVLPNICIVDSKLNVDQISTFDTVSICAKLKHVDVSFP